MALHFGPVCFVLQPLVFLSEPFDLWFAHFMILKFLILSLFHLSNKNIAVQGVQLILFYGIHKLLQALIQFLYLVAKLDNPSVKPLLSNPVPNHLDTTQLLSSYA